MRKVVRWLGVLVGVLVVGVLVTPLLRRELMVRQFQTAEHIEWKSVQGWPYQMRVDRGTPEFDRFVKVLREGRGPGLGDRTLFVTADFRIWPETYLVWAGGRKAPVMFHNVSSGDEEAVRLASGKVIVSRKSLEDAFFTGEAASIVRTVEKEPGRFVRFLYRLSTEGGESMGWLCTAGPHVLDLLVQKSSQHQIPTWWLHERYALACETMGDRPDLYATSAGPHRRKAEGLKPTGARLAADQKRIAQWLSQGSR